MQFTDKLAAVPDAGGGAAAAGGAASEPAKKQKKQKPAASKEVVGVWLWQAGKHFGKGKWKEYGSADTDVIEAAFAAKEKTVELTLGGSAYVIDFKEMEQRLKANPNRIRRTAHSRISNTLRDTNLGACGQSSMP